MKLKSIATSVALLALTLPVFAQNAEGGGQAPSATAQQGTAQTHASGRETPLQRMTEQLNLTSDQQEKLRPVFQQFGEQMRSLHQDTSLSQEQKQEKMKSLHESTMSQINAVLTPEQQEKWKQLRQQQFQGHHGMGMGHGGAQQPQ